MFTGLIEEIGPVLGVASGKGLTEFRLGARFAGDLSIGESVAVNGACLTVTEVFANGFATQVVPETLRRTNLGQIGNGDCVNLERALRADGRLGGHIVQGHVDCSAKLATIQPDGDAKILSLTHDPEYSPQIVEKGFVALNGTSLTVTSAGDGNFSVALIPHTLKVTTFGALTAGDECNLETDILAKYIVRLAAAAGSAA